jgi:hypothetical protein
MQRISSTGSSSTCPPGCRVVEFGGANPPPWETASPLHSKEGTAGFRGGDLEMRRRRSAARLLVAQSNACRVQPAPKECGETVISPPPVGQIWGGMGEQVQRCKFPVAVKTLDAKGPRQGPRNIVRSSPGFKPRALRGSSTSLPTRSRLQFRGSGGEAGEAVRRSGPVRQLRPQPKSERHVGEEAVASAAAIKVLGELS